MPATSPPVSIGPALTEQQAREIYAPGEEAVVFALLQLAVQLAAKSAQAAATSHDTPATPSGMKPVFTKPAVKIRGKKQPGRKIGHLGSRRSLPQRIDAREEHRAKACPHCGGPLCRCAETRTRYVEEIPYMQHVVTEHTIHRDWCPNCKKKVEPPLTAALPGSMMGNRVLIFTAWLHYGLGNTLSQIVEVFNFHLQMRITPVGLLWMWYRLAEILQPWYQQLQQEALKSGVLHADESGWRVNGKTHWLWCFAHCHLTYFMIDRSRGSPALAKFFTEEFGGTLVSDFWGAYNAVACALRQTCLVHLLRDLEHTEKYKSPGPHWPEFAKLLRRLIGDAIRLWRAGPIVGRDLCLASPAADGTPGGLDRETVAGGRSAPPDQAPEATSCRSVYVPGSTRSSLRQQSRRACHSSGGDHPQEQLRQSQRARGRHSSHLNEYFLHTQKTRPQSD